MSQLGFGDDGSADAVVLARGSDDPDIGADDDDPGSPDALTGGALAIAKDAPLLLTRPDRLPIATAAEIERLLGDEGTVYVLGGKAAISDDVAGLIEEMDYEVERIAGDNRYETAVQIAELIEPDGPLLVGTGRNFPDALSAGAAAGHHGGAVLLTNDEQLPNVTAEFIDGHDAEVFAVGGPAAEALGDDATPLVGGNRYDTAVKVAEEFFELPTEGLEGFVLASGQNFPDALSGAASSGRSGHPVLLTQADNLPAVTTNYVEEITEGRLLLAVVLGGEKAISEGVFDALNAALNPDSDD